MSEYDELVGRARKQAYRLISDRAAMKAGYGVAVSPKDQDEVEELLDSCADAIQSLQGQVEELKNERGDVASYLVRNVLRPHNANPLGDIMGICTQVDHICHTARNAALEEALEAVSTRSRDWLGQHKLAADEIAAAIRNMKER